VVITAQSRSNPSVKATCTVKLSSNPVERIRIGEWRKYTSWKFEELENQEIGLNKTFDFDIRVNDNNDRNADTDVIWESSNTSVVTIDENGTARAVGIGSAVITATHKDDSRRTATCTVTVRRSP
jgi:hypothetical protein